MKTTVEHNNKEQETKYPFIGISSNKQIILFYRKGAGICLERGGGVQCAGYYSETWVMPFFKPYNGKITLEND